MADGKPMSIGKIRPFPRLLVLQNSWDSIFFLNCLTTVSYRDHMVNLRQNLRSFQPVFVSVLELCRPAQEVTVCFFPSATAVMWGWWLDISCPGNVYTMAMYICCKEGPSTMPSRDPTVKHLPARHSLHRNIAVVSTADLSGQQAETPLFAKKHSVQQIPTIFSSQHPTIIELIPLIESWSRIAMFGALLLCFPERLIYD